MREHHALGIAGGAGSVHERGQVIGSQSRDAAAQFASVPSKDLPATSDESCPSQKSIGRCGGLFEHYYALERPNVSHVCSYFLPLRPGRYKQPADFSVNKLINDLLA